jgi:hypothetical protein
LQIWSLTLQIWSFALEGRDRSCGGPAHGLAGDRIAESGRDRQQRP